MEKDPGKPGSFGIYEMGENRMVCVDAGFLLQAS